MLENRINHADSLNQKPKPHNKITVVSLLRVPLVFQFLNTLDQTGLTIAVKRPFASVKPLVNGFQPLVNSDEQFITLLGC